MGPAAELIMTYTFSLQAMAIAAGAILCLLCALGFFTRHPGPLQRFPRSRVAGIILLTIDLIWSWWLLATMDMGEFSNFRKPFLVALPIAYFLSLRFMNEFLAVRALGILGLLAAEPLLDAAFFRYETSRLVLTVFAYAIIIFGIIWVTMPYRLRDQLDWLGRSGQRWRGLNLLGFFYGVVLLTLAFVAY